MFRFGTVVLIIIALIMSAMGFGVHSVYKMQKFCDTISVGHRMAEVIHLASEKEMFISDSELNSEGIVTLLNHRAPQFRMACNIEYRNGVVISAHTTVAD